MDPQIVKDPFSRTQALILASFSSPLHKPLPSVPDWKNRLKNQAFNEYYAALDTTQDPATLTFMRNPQSFKNLDTEQFRAWLGQLKKLNSIHVIFEEKSLLNFTEPMLEAWRKAAIPIVSIKFKSSLPGEVRGITQILKGVSQYLTHLEFRDCEKIIWEDWLTLAAACINLSECCLINCPHINIQVACKFIDANPYLKKISLGNLSISSEIFNAISQRFEPFEELSLDRSTVTDEILLAAKEIPVCQLTKLSLNGCRRVSERGLIPFLQSWQSIQKLSLEAIFDRVGEKIVPVGPCLSSEGVAHLLALPHLRSLSLSHFQTSFDDALNEQSLATCALFELNLQETQISAAGLKFLLEMVKSLEVVDVSYCPCLTSADIVTLQQEFPRVNLKSHLLPKKLDSKTPLNPIRLGINLKLFVSTLFPYSDVTYDEDKKRCELKFSVEASAQPSLWGDELKQMVGLLSTMQVSVTIAARADLTKVQAPAFFAFLSVLAPAITELVLRGGHIPSGFFPRLNKLEIHGGNLTPEILKGLTVPALKTLSMNNTRLNAEAADLIGTVFVSVNEWALKGLQPYPWRIILAFHNLIHTTTCHFVVPSDPLIDPPVDIAFTLWRNQLDQVASQQLAQQYLQEHLGTFNLNILCRAYKLQFTNLIQKMVEAWNNKYGFFLQLTYEKKCFKAEIQLPLSNQISLSNELCMQIVALAGSLSTINWTVRMVSETSLTLPLDLKILAEAISPHISYFTWLSEVKEEKNTFPSPLLQPFLERSGNLKCFAVADVSFTNARLKEVLMHRGLEKLKLHCCEGIDAEEIRSWKLWSHSLQELTLSDCKFVGGPTLDTAIADTFPFLKKLKLENCQSVKNNWLHALSTACTTLERLNLNGTSIDNGCFTPAHFKFSTLQALSVAETQVSDQGIERLAYGGDRYLKRLDISKCKVIGSCFASWTTPLLDTVLWRDSELVTEKGLMHLGPIAPNLRVLDLTGSKLHWLRGVATILENCLLLEQLIVKTDELPIRLKQALGTPFGTSTTLEIKERRLNDDKLFVWSKTLKKCTHIILHGCSGITQEGLSEILIGKEILEADFFVRLEGHKILAAFHQSARRLQKLIIRAPLGGLDDLKLASFLLLAPELRTLTLEHRPENKEKCSLTPAGLERILQRENFTTELILQGIDVKTNNQRLSIVPASDIPNPWSPRKDI